MLRKPVFIAISYTYLIVTILRGDQTVSFTVFLSLIIELLIIALIYLAYAIHSKRFTRILKAVNVLFSSFLLILFTYSIAYATSFNYKEFVPRDIYHKIDLLDPLIYFKDIIFIIILNLSISYSLDTFKVFKDKSSFRKVEQSAIYQGLLIWIIASVGLISLFLFGDQSKIYILLLIIVSRIVAEFFFREKFIKSKSLRK